MTGKLRNTELLVWLRSTSQTTPITTTSSASNKRNRAANVSTTTTSQCANPDGSITFSGGYLCALPVRAEARCCKGSVCCVRTCVLPRRSSHIIRKPRVSELDAQRLRRANGLGNRRLDAFVARQRHGHAAAALHRRLAEDAQLR